jgi:hypothetical protein
VLSASVIRVIALRLIQSSRVYWASRCAWAGPSGIWAPALNDNTATPTWEVRAVLWWQAIHTTYCQTLLFLYLVKYSPSHKMVQVKYVGFKEARLHATQWILAASKEEKLNLSFMYTRVYVWQIDTKIDFARQLLQHVSKFLQLLWRWIPRTDRNRHLHYVLTSWPFWKDGLKVITSQNTSNQLICLTKVRRVFLEAGTEFLNNVYMSFVQGNYV